MWKRTKVMTLFIETYYQQIILMLLVDMDARGNKLSYLHAKFEINTLKKQTVIKL